jgi:ketosteroid isomerase-like protein
MKNLFLIAAVIFFAGSSCQKKYDPEADKQALINLTSEDFDANFLSGNPDASIEFYTDAALLIEDGMKYSGKEAIRTKLTSVRDGFRVATHENRVEDTWISGDVATVRGTFLGSWVHDEWGDTLLAKSAWVDVCERQKDGSWKMVLTLTTELRE